VIPRYLLLLLLLLLLLHILLILICFLSLLSDCTSTGSLVLEGNQLSGNIPSQLGNLQNLGKFSIESDRVRCLYLHCATSLLIANFLGLVLVTFQMLYICSGCLYLHCDTWLLVVAATYHAYLFLVTYVAHVHEQTYKVLVCHQALTCPTTNSLEVCLLHFVQLILSLKLTFGTIITLFAIAAWSEVGCVIHTLHEA
jgi:hypothetical protein